MRLIYLLFYVQRKNHIYGSDSILTPTPMKYAPQINAQKLNKKKCCRRGAIAITYESMMILN